MLRLFGRTVRRAAALALAAGLVAAGAADAQSQATTGIIRGTVSDPNGAPVAGATIQLHETPTGFQRSITSNASGVFVASLLPLGTYDVTARAVGFNEARRTGVAVRVRATVELALAVTAIELQAVTVEAALPVVDVTRVESATRFSEEGSAARRTTAATSSTSSTGGRGSTGRPSLNYASTRSLRTGLNTKSSARG